MPELPELEVMREVLEVRVLARPICGARAFRPGILQTVEPPLEALAGRSFRGVGRRGKHLILSCDENLRVVLHLMVAGRLVLTKSASKVTKATGFVISFDDGEDLRLVENGTAKRAKVHIVRRAEDVEWVARSGIEPLSGQPLSGQPLSGEPQGGEPQGGLRPETLARLIGGERRQLKKVLTDQTLVAGIGTAYADEILFRARLSPIRYGNTLEPDEIERLCAAIHEILAEGIERTRRQSGGALVGERRREGMAVYKRTGEPCSSCGEAIAEIRFAETRTYYCPRCQAKGKTIADRRAWLRR
jgi:formamidopyrimidine-DNA glycosylase